MTATGRRRPVRDHCVLQIGSQLLLTMGGNFYDSMASRDSPSLAFYEFTEVLTMKSRV